MRFLFYLILLWLLIISCSTISSNDEKQVDLRSLTWKADTLWHAGELQIQMENIVGTGLNNILIAGHAAGPAYSIYTYDQGKIKVEPFHSINGGNIGGYFDAQNVFIFSDKDKWACGDGPNDTYRVIRFNGEQWGDIPFEATSYSKTGLTSIWGVYPNEVWFSGYEGVLFHWDGEVIRRDSLPDPYIADPNQFLNQSDLTGDPFGNVYYLMRSMDSTASNRVYFLFKRENDQWKRINYMAENYMSIVNIWCSPSGTLYGAGAGGIRKYNFSSNTWEWFKLFEGNDVFAVYGPSDNDLLATGYHELFHYNGKDWQEIEAPTNSEVSFWGIWTDGKEAFVVAQWNNKSIIYHGK